MNIRKMVMTTAALAMLTPLIAATPSFAEGRGFAGHMAAGIAASPRGVANAVGGGGVRMGGGWNHGGGVAAGGGGGGWNRGGGGGGWNHGGGRGWGGGGFIPGAVAGAVIGGAIANSARIPLGQLSGRTAELDGEKLIAVHCKGGYRSSIATSILRRAGFRDVVNLTGGYDAWKVATHS